MEADIRGRVGQNLLVILDDVGEDLLGLRDVVRVADAELEIDAAHPRQRNDVEQPDSVKAAKRKADKIKQRKGAEELFKDEDDPFAGL